MFWYDSTYILILIGVAISAIASARVNSTYSKYSRVRSMSGMTGAEAAEKILHVAGIYDVQVTHVRGRLTDHYDPRAKVLRLSDAVYGQSSVAAIGVAAHECGHAIQHHTGYAPLSIRSAIVPVANFGSQLSWPLFLIGLFINGNTGYALMMGGIILFSAALLFQLVTLPVEFNASSRAVRILGETGILREDELPYTKKVLGAAALTYVAAVLASILQLFRLFILAGGRRRD